MVDRSLKRYWRENISPKKPTVQTLSNQIMPNSGVVSEETIPENNAGDVVSGGLKDSVNHQEVDFSAIKVKQRYDHFDGDNWYVVRIEAIETLALDPRQVAGESVGSEQTYPGRVRIHYTQWKTDKYDRWIGVYKFAGESGSLVPQLDLDTKVNLKPLHTFTKARSVKRKRAVRKPTYEYVEVVEDSSTPHKTPEKEEDHSKFVYFTTKRGRRQKMLRSKYLQQQKQQPRKP